MPEPWKIPKDLWKGAAVAILAGGPSLTPEMADSLRDKGYKVIVVNYAYRLAPWADMLIITDSDPEFFEAADAMGFAGMKVCGGSYDMPGVLYLGQRTEIVQIGPVHTIDFRNSGITAIRLAAEAGAAKVILMGFDPEVHGHWAGYPTDAGQDDAGPEPYPHLTAALAAVMAELRAKGIEVERVSQTATLTDEEVTVALESAANHYELLQRDSLSAGE